MSNPVALSAKQITKAKEIYDKAEYWRISDDLLEFLRLEAKSGSYRSQLYQPNHHSLYGTRVTNLKKAAETLKGLLERQEKRELDYRFVDAFADEMMEFVKGQRIISFPSKYAHFFIDSDEFPIFDSFAARMLNRHLGNNLTKYESKVLYRNYVDDFNRLRHSLRFNASTREIDRYLWLAEQYISKREQRKAYINEEVVELIKNHEKTFLAMLPDAIRVTL